MDRVNFTFKRGGRTKQVSPQQAKLLSRVGLGSIENRSMADKPQVTKAPEERRRSVDLGASTSVDDGLDTLDKEQLHALAKERGVYVHHLSGADKVRAVLREQK